MSNLPLSTPGWTVAHRAVCWSTRSAHYSGKSWFFLQWRNGLDPVYPWLPSPRLWWRKAGCLQWNNRVVAAGVKTVQIPAGLMEHQSILSGALIITAPTTGAVKKYCILFYYWPKPNGHVIEIIVQTIYCNCKIPVSFPALHKSISDKAP